MSTFKNLIDTHIHTDNSDDGFDHVTLMCESAEKSGMRVLAVTDHCECNRYRRDSFDRAIRQSFFAAQRAKAAFDGKLIVLAGMELGQAMQDLDAAEDALAANSYDFVLGSLHNVKGMPDIWKIDFKENDAYEIFSRYLDQTLELVEWGKFDSLAHITYPLRYIIGVEHIDLDLNDYKNKTDEILSLLAEKEMALEVNTSGLRQDYGKTLPGIEIVKRFRELGGKYVTIGSDAHHYYDVGAGIAEGLEIIKAAGFESITIFQNREPMPVVIE